MKLKSKLCIMKDFQFVHTITFFGKKKNRHSWQCLILKTFKVIKKNCKKHETIIY